MGSVFNKTFFKFLFGFILIIIFSLLGVAFSNNYFGGGGNMFISTSEAK
ncbi:MAG: hypothetical protein M0P76_06250 [Candidatus Pacebacteria bacterium]|jgi:hypothetical protein|nr:hypothetical protein [Candidatus Paceibacterota bacterium]